MQNRPEIYGSLLDAFVTAVEDNLSTDDRRLRDALVKHFASFDNLWGPKFQKIYLTELNSMNEPRRVAFALKLFSRFDISNSVRYFHSLVSSGSNEMRYDYLLIKTVRSSDLFSS